MLRQPHKCLSCGFLPLSAEWGSRADVQTGDLVPSPGPVTLWWLWPNAEVQVSSHVNKGLYKTLACLRFCKHIDLKKSNSKCGFSSPLGWAWSPVLPLTICVTLGKWLNFYVKSFQLSHLKMCQWLALPYKVMWGLNEAICV